MQTMLGNDRPDRAKRLEKARIHRGFATAKDAAKYFGFSYETYIQHEQGTRGISRRSERYAKAFRVSEAWLLTGEGDGPEQDSQAKIPVVGLVGAGYEIFPIDDHQKGGGLEEVDMPLPNMSPSTVAVRVRGTSMEPAYYDGDLIFYDRKDGGDLIHLLGRECVVALADGRIFIKILKRRSNGDWFLHSNNAEPILDIQIDWAAKVKVIQRS
jgi:phage repressor protein C with HTH and peptisase S24 domain